MSIFFTTKQTKNKNTWSPSFSYDMKIATDGYLGIQSINTERASLKMNPANF